MRTCTIAGSLTAFAGRWRLIIHPTTGIAKMKQFAQTPLSFPVLSLGRTTEMNALGCEHYLLTDNDDYDNHRAGIRIDSIRWIEQQQYHRKPYSLTTCHGSKRTLVHHPIRGSGGNGSTEKL